MKFSINITIGQYFYQNSLIHKLDPRVKILTTILVIISLFLIKSWFGFSIIALYLFINIFLSKVHPKFVLKGIKPLIIIIIITLIIHFLTTPGEVIYHIWILNITKEGIQKGLFIAVRLFLLIVATSWLTLTTSPIALTDGIERLLSVLKFYQSTSS